MANRRPQNAGRRMEYGRDDRGKGFGRASVSPWQGSGPSTGLPNLLPLTGTSEATLALANNLISNLLQSRQNNVPSLLDMPMRRDFCPDMRYDRGFPSNRMGNQGNFRRTGTYNRAGERINTNRKPFRSNDGPRNKTTTPKKDAADKAKSEPKTDKNESKDESMEVNEATVKTEDTGEEKKEDSKKEAPKTRYDDIHPSMLRCHICNKTMWDGRSFENHLNGRAHSIMMHKTAESYALTADTMRQEFKIREMKLTRKSGQQTNRDFYCAMCDIYAADGAIHRTTVGHRKLKKYLHPNCATCHKEMATRIELDEHRLTPEHMRVFHDKKDVDSRPKPEVMVLSTLSMEQSYVREDRRKRHHSQTEKNEKDDQAEKEGGNDEDADMKPSDADVKPSDDGEEKKEEAIDPENTVLDFGEEEDLSHVTVDMLPKYNTARGVGASFLAPFACVQCRLCRKLLDSAATAQVHLRTWRHHQLYHKLLRERAGLQGNEGNKRTVPNNEGGEEDGQWKRRKTEADGEQSADNEEDKAEETEVKEETEELNDAEGTNWEKTVDEILNDEQQNGEADEETVKEEPPKEKVQEPEAEVEKPPPPTPAKNKPSPRGRGRGRRRV